MQLSCDNSQLDEQVGQTMPLNDVNGLGQIRRHQVSNFVPLIIASPVLQTMIRPNGRCPCGPNGGCSCRCVQLTLKTEH
jgi:hypothetical protein